MISRKRMTCVCVNLMKVQDGCAFELNEIDCDQQSIDTDDSYKEMLNELLTITEKYINKINKLRK